MPRAGLHRPHSPAASPDLTGVWRVAWPCTAGLTIGDPVERTGAPLQVELGPGMMDNIFDGIQRPLKEIAAVSKSVFVPRGVRVDSLDHKKKWEFFPSANIKVCVACLSPVCRRPALCELTRCCATATAFQKNDPVSGGTVIGYVPENELIHHHWIMVPPLYEGRVVSLAPHGMYTLDDTILVLQDPVTGAQENVRLSHYWPVRRARPCQEKLPATEPLITGQRVLDSLFPYVPTHPPPPPCAALRCAALRRRPPARLPACPPPESARRNKPSSTHPDLR